MAWVRVLHGAPPLILFLLSPASSYFSFPFSFSKVGFKLSMELRENDLEHVFF